MVALYRFTADFFFPRSPIRPMPLSPAAASKSVSQEAGEAQDGATASSACSKCADRTWAGWYVRIGDGLSVRGREHRNWSGHDRGESVSAPVLWMSCVWWHGGGGT